MVTGDSGTCTGGWVSLRFTRPVVHHLVIHFYATWYGNIVITSDNDGGMIFWEHGKNVYSYGHGECDRSLRYHGRNHMRSLVGLFSSIRITSGVLGIGF